MKSAVASLLVAAGEELSLVQPLLLFWGDHRVGSPGHKSCCLQDRGQGWRTWVAQTRDLFWELGCQEGLVQSLAGWISRDVDKLPLLR